MQFINSNNNLSCNPYQFTACMLIMLSHFTTAHRMFLNIEEAKKQKEKEVEIHTLAMYYEPQACKCLSSHALNTANMKWVLNVLYAPKPKQSPVSLFCNQLCKCSSPQMQQKKKKNHAKSDVLSMKTSQHQFTTMPEKWKKRVLFPHWLASMCLCCLQPS